MWHGLAIGSAGADHAIGGFHLVGILFHSRFGPILRIGRVGIFFHVWFGTVGRFFGRFAVERL
jgi:hypothetical protein